MVDWTRANRYKIENVEHQIHICGVKTPVWPYVVVSFALCLWINPLLFFTGPSLIILLARKFWLADEAGRSIEYERWFCRRFGKSKIMAELFRCLPFIKHAEDFYR